MVPDLEVALLLLMWPLSLSLLCPQTYRPVHVCIRVYMCVLAQTHTQCERTDSALRLGATAAGTEGALQGQNLIAKLSQGCSYPHRKNEMEYPPSLHQHGDL